MRVCICVRVCVCVCSRVYVSACVNLYIYPCSVRFPSRFTIYLVI